MPRVPTKVIKLENIEEVVIGGYTYPEGKREGFGSLLMGMFKGKELKYIGHTGSGFEEKELLKLKEVFDKNMSDKSPFSDAPKMNNVAAWIKPKIVGQIKFTGWTGEGYMRHAVFLGIRDDKEAKEVIYRQ